MAIQISIPDIIIPELRDLEIAYRDAKRNVNISDALKLNNEYYHALFQLYERLREDILEVRRELGKLEGQARAFSDQLNFGDLEEKS